MPIRIARFANDGLLTVADCRSDSRESGHGKLPARRRGFRLHMQDVFVERSIAGISVRTDASCKSGTKTLIYLDYPATTPMMPEVLEAMMPFLSGDDFANPHAGYPAGLRVASAIEHAREQIAELIGAQRKEIVFTSGATESCNLAIQGAASFRATHLRRRGYILATSTEHPCVRESCLAVSEREGFGVDFLAPQRSGLIGLQQLRQAWREDVFLVCVLALHNETGVRQPIALLGAFCRGQGALLLCDGAQAVGKIPMHVHRQNIDFLSISAHKMYGPKGIGALYIRRRPRVRISPLLVGGGQERGLRAGTLPAALCVGFGKAAEIARYGLQKDRAHIVVLAQIFWRALKQAFPYARLNGTSDGELPGNPDLSADLAGESEPDSNYYPGILNVCFPDVPAEKLLARVPELVLSAGSACKASQRDPSPTLLAMNLGHRVARSSLRIGFGRPTTRAEAHTAGQTLGTQAAILRAKTTTP